MKTCALLLCGGSGRRMGVSCSKTLLPVGGIPGIVRCFRAFEGLVDAIVVVARREDVDTFRQVLSQYQCVPYAITPGGEDRQASALAGLSALPEDTHAVLIHDGARPFVSPALIRRVMDSVAARGSGVAAVPARDTIKRADEQGRVLETPDRATLWQVQTPQGFRLADLRAAHIKAPGRYTDDAALMEAAGYPVQLVMGEYTNLKLTSQEDLRMADQLLTPRVGTGFDAHRLVENRALWLGGVHIPYEKGLLGHSDADAALHALMDALLGAAALGDIGRLFPDTDGQYKDISSLLLLEKTGSALEEHGFSVGNVDVTIIAQAPKLAPYLPAMRSAIAGALKTAVENVSVKATTTERMGYEGREEGISAMATALVYQRR